MTCTCWHCQLCATRSAAIASATPKLAEGTERNPGLLADGTAPGTERSPVSYTPWRPLDDAPGVVPSTYSDSFAQERASDRTGSLATEPIECASGQENASTLTLEGRPHPHAAGSVDSGSTVPGTEYVPAPSTKPCCRRIGYTRWCARDDGHQGECDGPPERGPADEAQFYTRVGGGR